MIRGVHTMFYSSAAPDLRAFLRDKLGLSATDGVSGPPHENPHVGDSSPAANSNLISVANVTGW